MHIQNFVALTSVYVFHSVPQKNHPSDSQRTFYAESHQPLSSLQEAAQMTQGPFASWRSFCINTQSTKREKWDHDKFLFECHFHVINLCYGVSAQTSIATK